MTPLYIPCDCSSLDHTVRMSYEIEEPFAPELYIETQLAEYRGFFKRLRVAFRYLFGLTMTVHEFIFRRSDIPRVVRMMQQFYNDSSEDTEDQIRVSYPFGYQLTLQKLNPNAHETLSLSTLQLIEQLLSPKFVTLIDDIRGASQKHLVEMAYITARAVSSEEDSRAVAARIRAVSPPLMSAFYIGLPKEYRMSTFKLNESSTAYAMQMQIIEKLPQELLVT